MPVVIVTIDCGVDQMRLILVPLRHGVLPPRIERLLVKASARRSPPRAPPRQVQDQRVPQWADLAGQRAAARPRSRSPVPGAYCGGAAPGLDEPGLGTPGPLLRRCRLASASDAAVRDPEVLGDLPQRRLPRAGNSYHIAAELDRNRLRHVDHPPSEGDPDRQGGNSASSSHDSVLNTQPAPSM